MRLTAIVPNYNQEHFLLRAIESLAAQVPCADEILVIDDASTDNSLAVLAALEGRHPSLRVIRHERNLGTISALNRGLGEARGQYIYLGAADDQVLPGLFALGLGLLEAHPGAAFACAECRIVDQAGVDRGMRPLARPTARTAYVPAARVPGLLRRIDNWAHTSTAVVRRELVVATGGLDPALGSFADGFLLRRLALAHGFCFAPQLVAQWTISPGGMSRSTVGNLETMIRILAAARQRFASDPVFPPWYADLFERRLRWSSARIALGSLLPPREVIDAVAAERPLDRMLFRAALAVPDPAGRFLALAWLTLRKRPVSLVAVAHTALARRLRPSRI